MYEKPEGIESIEDTMKTLKNNMVYNEIV